MKIASRSADVEFRNVTRRFGSVVAVGCDGAIESSVAIRTAWVADGQARYWCGGAVVWDSDAQAEHREAYAKATPFLRALGAET